MYVLFAPIALLSQLHLENCNYSQQCPLDYKVVSYFIKNTMLHLAFIRKCFKIEKGGNVKNVASDFVRETCNGLTL